MEVSSTAMRRVASTRAFFRNERPHDSGFPAAMLRPMPKHAIARSNHDLGRIVEEALAEYLVAAPFLQAHFIEAADPAGFVGQLENPVNGYEGYGDHR